jgi:polygalacturonase
VLIENCFISTGDDAVAVKSGMDAAGVAYGKPTRNVVVRNLVVGRTHALSIGSEMSGGVANVLFQVTLLHQIQAENFLQISPMTQAGCSCITESGVACSFQEC